MNIYMMDGLYFKAGLMPAPITVSDVRTNITAVRKRYAPPWDFSFKYPLRSLWGGKRFNAIAVDDAASVENKEKSGRNWVLNILKFRSLRRDLERCDDGGGEMKVESEEDERNECGGDEGCEVCDDGEGVVDKESFGKMLRRVTLGEARLYAQISYLGSLAYSIPMIKPGNLLKRHGLRFVTSSLEKKEQALKVEKDKVLVQEIENALAQEKENSSAQTQDKEEGASAEDLPEVQEAEATPEDTVDVVEDKNDGNQIGGSTAYRIAASAASYLHSRTTSLLTFKSLKPEMSEDSPNGSRVCIGNVDMLNSIDMMNGDMASFIATTDSVTSVVAAKEEVKQAVADDLNSTTSSPCGWFICDDDQTATRFFVVQGSESLASWQANLLFEPIQFEGLDVLVHRGIYEAAKGIYEQMLPEVRDHVKNHGSHAYFRFTGHSLGGSLSLLLNLMLLIRGEVPRSSLLPVITFGAPSIMCGGDQLLRKLGLPKSHVQSIAMHRDIVPRAFSCHYPNHVAELLKAVNRNFRNHPCLKSQGLLYAPVGEFLILQPDEKFSPHHDLLPSGSGLYVLSCPISDVAEAEKQIRAAQSLFLNSPHPLEMLRDRSSYGSEGTILRDHDMRSYLKSVRNVIRQELNQVRKGQREHRRKVRWPLVAARGSNASITMGRPVASSNMEQSQFKFAGVLQTGRESMKRFSRLVASQHMHLLVVFLLPARTIILGAYSIINFH
ncbi:hypothetical protein AgCh_038941 [Apium graveolens]